MVKTGELIRSGRRIAEQEEKDDENLMSILKVVATNCHQFLLTGKWLEYFYVLFAKTMSSVQD